MKKEHKFKKFGYADIALNPVVGCRNVSSGCDKCWAKSMARRLQHIKSASEVYENITEKGERGIYWTGKNRYIDARINQLLHVNKKVVALAFMSDLFYQPNIKKLRTIFDNMCSNYLSTFILLTKRPNKLKKLAHYLFNSPPNIYFGVSSENKETTHRVKTLQSIPNIKRWISFEPLLEDVGELDLTGIDQVIVGGESSTGARFMNPEWAYNIYKQCKDQKVPFFLKQWGTSKEKDTYEGSSTIGYDIINMDQCDELVWRTEPTNNKGVEK